MCGCCCCCKEDPPPQPTRSDVTVSPIFGPITTQPPTAASAIQLPYITTVTTHPPQGVTNTTHLIPISTSFTMQSTTVNSISGTVPIITGITMQMPAVNYVTKHPPGIANIATQSPVTANIASSPPFIIADNRLAAAGPLRPPGSNMSAAAAAPSAPPPPAATEHYWAKTALSHTEPSVALAEGLYVGRAVLGAHTLPAILETKLLIDTSTGVTVERFAAANFFYKDLAGCTEDFEVLACSRTSWVSALGGHVAPENAIVCGRTPSGSPLYMGRVFDEGAYHYGTADPEEGVLFCMARAGCVRTSEHFDILVAA